MTKIAILGAAGRMGQALVRASRRIKDMEIVAAIEMPGHEAIGQDAGLVADVGEIGVNISDDPKIISQADVAIDFTLHDSVPRNAALAAEAGVPMVIGTTGLNDDERAAVERAASRIPIVWAPNMSLGVNLLFAAVKQAGALLGIGYQVEIDETHHVHKKDSPSGTALNLGRKVAEGRGHDFEKVLIKEEGKTFQPGEAALEEDVTPDYPEGSIVIRSYREGEVVGDHTVTFANDGETIEFTHHAWNREAFAGGALRAAQWVVTQRPRLYDMQDVLGL